MQVSVTSKNIRKSNKRKIKSTISAILILLCATISSIALICARKKYLVYDERCLYFVSATSSKKEKQLSVHQELFKNLGGANVVYKHEQNYYLIAGVYLDLGSAEEIKNNLSAYFSESEVLKIKTKKVNVSLRKMIKKGKGSEEFVRFIYSLPKKYQEIQMNYLAGKITDGEFLSKLVRIRLNLNEMVENIEVLNEISEKLAGFGVLYLMKMTSFLNGFEISQNKQNYISNYFVSFYINYEEMFNSL